MPNPWEPEWMNNPAFQHAPTGASPSPSSGEGASGPGGVSQPSYDPNETWVELPKLEKLSIIGAFELIDALRKAGVPVVGGKARRSSLFSGKKVDLTLSVPQRCLGEAEKIITQHLGPRIL